MLLLRPDLCAGQRCARPADCRPGHWRGLERAALPGPTQPQSHCMHHGKAGGHFVKIFMFIAMMTFLHYHHLFYKLYFTDLPCTFKARFSIMYSRHFQMLSWCFTPLWRTSCACVGWVKKVPQVSRCAVWSVPGPAASRRYRSRSQAVVSSRAQRQHSPAELINSVAAVNTPSTQCHQPVIRVI